MNLTLCLTHNCNLRCSYCYAGRKTSRTMTWETARAAIDFAIAETLDTPPAPGKERTVTLGFFGGEPLLEWDMLKRCHEYMAEQAKQHDIKLVCTLTTNMTLLNDEKWEWLSGRDYFLGLSLDGNAAMHNTCRKYEGGKGSHEDCRRELKYFNREDARAEIILVVTPENVEHLGDSVKWLSENTPLKICLNPNFGCEWDQQSLDVLTDQYKAVAAHYCECYRQGRPFRLNVIDGKIKTHLWDGYKDCDKCGFGEKEIAVSAAGNFYPCARLVGEDNSPDLIFGNADDGYDNAKRIRHILGRGNRTKECMECALRERCMNWCGCVNYVTSNGKIDEVGAFTCFHERLGISLSDQVATTLWEEKNPCFLTRFYKNYIRA